MHVALSPAPGDVERLGGRVGDISHAVESYVRSQGDYGIVEEYDVDRWGTDFLAAVAASSDQRRAPEPTRPSTPMTIR